MDESAPNNEKQYTLPNDAAKCSNSTCSLRNECLRHLAQDDKNHQWFNFYEPVDAISCAGLIKINEEPF